MTTDFLEFVSAGGSDGRREEGRAGTWMRLVGH
jgi:hypothetical protein